MPTQFDRYQVGGQNVWGQGGLKAQAADSRIAAANAPQGPSYGQGAVQTSIPVHGVQSPQNTQYGVNLAAAEHHQQGNMPYLMKQYDTPGVSRSAATFANAMPQFAQHQMGALQARIGMPLDDAFTNQGEMLRRQTAREKEFMGLGNLAARLSEIQSGLGNAQANQQTGVLNQLL